MESRRVSATHVLVEKRYGIRERLIACHMNLQSQGTQDAFYLRKHKESGGVGTARIFHWKTVGVGARRGCILIRNRDWVHYIGGWGGWPAVYVIYVNVIYINICGRDVEFEQIQMCSNIWLMTTEKSPSIKFNQPKNRSTNRHPIWYGNFIILHRFMATRMTKFHGLLRFLSCSDMSII